MPIKIMTVKLTEDNRTKLNSFSRNTNRAQALANRAQALVQQNLKQIKL